MPGFVNYKHQFHFFGLTRPVLEPMIYCTQGEHVYTNVIKYNIIISTCIINLDEVWKSIQIWCENALLLLSLLPVIGNFIYKNKLEIFFSFDLKPLIDLICLSQDRTWISNVISCGLFFLCSVMQGEKQLFVRFVDIGGIVDHYSLNCVFQQDNLKVTFKYRWLLNGGDMGKFDCI